MLLVWHPFLLGLITNKLFMEQNLTQSIWEGTATSPQNFAAFEVDAHAAVVINGGGISGITAALLLSNAGKKVTLLESHRIGLGTTGNSTGNLYVTVDLH